MTDLRAMYRDMAAKGANFHGLSILSHGPVIGGLIHRTGARSLLDYGSGAGHAYQPPYLLHLTWGVAPPVLYDPSFPEHDVMPAMQFDGVLCSDVLEHIPQPDVDQVIATLFDHAALFVWASVCCRPAKKRFPDGTNLHVTIQPFRWWADAFQRIADGRFYWLTETL